MSTDKFVGLNNLCTTEEHLITDEKICSYLVSHAGDSGNDNKAVAKNKVPPSWPTTDELVGINGNN